MEEKPPWKLLKASLSFGVEEDEEEEVWGVYSLGREENKVFI